MSARTRRSLTLLWTALFVFSLGLQYMTFAAPPSTLAVHDEGLFELDGNAVNDPAVLGDDWNQVYGNSSNADATTFLTDPTDQKLDQIFTGGGSKDDLNVNGGPGSGWEWTIGSVPDKDNITHAYAAAYKTATDTIVYFGLDRLANNGDAFVGFWFFKSGVGPIAAGDFSGQHTVGDLLVLSNFENGGTTATIELYEWVGSGGDTNNTLDKIATGNVCTGAPATDKACAVTNLTEVDSPWPYTPKFGTDGKFPVQSFFEGGINLTELYDGDPPCFSGILGETRSSSSVDAVLKDFAFGNFNTCEPPEISTTASASTINVGESVTDTADFTSNTPAVTGSVDFFVCGPTASATACTSGGTKVGATKTISGGTATSDPFPVTDPTKTGYYCFRAEYTPDQAGSLHYTAGSHTNATTECFQVIPAQVTILKTTSTGTVSAGDPISFTLSWGNSGAGQAKGVVVSDNLPTSNGLSWSISGSTGTGSTCQIAANVLTCNVGTIPGNTAISGTVTLTSNTTSANCGVISNTGHIASTNDGAADSTASVTVQCPALTIVKTADAASVNAGDPIGFTITVSNSSAAGTGTAKDVTLADPLPAGVTWTESPDNADCQITAGVLSCDFGDLAPGDSVSVHVSATTSAEACTIYDNTATASASNHPDVSASAVIECDTATIEITKTADAASVDAGDPIGFVVTVTNSGLGDAYGVKVNDPLPAGVTWSIDAGASDPGWSIAAGVLSYGGASGVTLAAGASVTVHVTAQTSFQACATYDNTASVTTTNDGSDEANAVIVCHAPDLTIVKTADAASVNAGDPIGFTITVSNSSAAGTGTAKDVTLADPLPAGVTWTESPDNADCQIAAGVLSCDFGDLAPGDSVSVHVGATTSAEACTVYDNTATASASNHPDVSASAVIECQPPDITVEKTADVTPIDAGDSASFTIEVWNAGPGIAYGATLTDTLPAGTWVVDNIDPNGVTGPVTCDPIVGGVLSCDLGTMEPGRGANSVFITIARQTSVAECTAGDYSLLNSVVVAATNEPAAAPLPNEDSATIDVLCPELGISKESDNEGPVSAGDQVGFTVTIVNSGTGSATGVSVDDPLPAGLDWTLVAADTDAGWSLSGPVGFQVLSFAGSLAAGQTSSAHVVATSDAADCGSIPNLASLYQDEVFVDDDDAAEVVLCAAIDLTKTADDAAVIAGDQIGFTLTVTNTGEGAAKDVHVADPLPTDPGLAWTIAVPVDGWSIVGGELVYDAATLAGGASSSVHVVSPTTRATCGAVDNTGTVTTSNDGTDSASASVTVICPALTLEKSNDAPIETIDLGDGITVDLPTLEEGDSATFTLVYTLVDGPVDNGVLTDVLPEGMAYVDGTASSNDEFSFVGYDEATRTLRWEAETVTESGTLTYEAQAQEGASDLAQPLVNVATIDSDQTDPDSDDSDVFVPIVEAVTSSPSITPPPTDTFAPATQAPSNPGFALMLVLLGLAGFALTLGFITPVPERIRRRDRRS